jgi:hypothetical protein
MAGQFLFVPIAIAPLAQVIACAKGFAFVGHGLEIRVGFAGDGVCWSISVIALVIRVFSDCPMRVKRRIVVAVS